VSITGEIMNILVTGGLGVNGVWVVRQLLEMGHKPIIYENGLDISLAPDFVTKVNKQDIVIGDILDLSSIIRTLKEHKIERIIHLAAVMPGTARVSPIIGLQVNCLGTVNILEAARIVEVRRVVFTSSKGVFAPVNGEYGYPTYKPVDESYPTYPQGPISVYGASKIASELVGIVYSEDFGMEFIALRFATIYGIGKSARHGTIAIHTKMIENAMVGKPTMVPYGGDEKDDMLYVKDCANAIVLACLAENVKHHIFNIGTGKSYTLHDLANSIKKVFPQAVFDIGPGLNYMNMPGTYCVMDFSKAREELGFSPEFDLDEGVRDYIESLRRLSIEPVYRP